MSPGSRTTILPGRVFDRTGTLDEVPTGYRAMNDRDILKFHRAGVSVATPQIQRSAAGSLTATCPRPNRLDHRGAFEESDDQSRLERRRLMLMRDYLRQLREHVVWHRERLQ